MLCQFSTAHVLTHFMFMHVSSVSKRLICYVLVLCSYFCLSIGRKHLGYNPTLQTLVTSFCVLSIAQMESFHEIHCIQVCFCLLPLFSFCMTTSCICGGAYQDLGHLVFFTVFMSLSIDNYVEATLPKVQSVMR